MTWFIFLVFIAGALFGVLADRHFRKTPTISVFEDEDQEEADGLRAEASQAVANRIERRKERIMQAAVEQGRITNDGVEDLFCISDATATNYLKQLVAENRLSKVGTTGRGVYYEPRQEPIN